MNRKVDEVRKRIAGRKQNALKMVNEELPVQKSTVEDTIDKLGYSIFEYEKKNSVSLGMGTFFLKIVFSILLVVGVISMFQSSTTLSKQVQSIVKHTMEREFQFAQVSKWYEERFGTPLTFLNNKIPSIKNQDEYAIPASGKVLENFQTNGQGILIETAVNAKVEAIDEGKVIYVGDKEQIGESVVIQHADGSESWYGALTDISVNIYDSVEKGEVIAKVSSEESEDTGTYYLAIKKDDGFIDPNQVISFE